MLVVVFVVVFVHDAAAAAAADDDDDDDDDDSDVFNLLPFLPFCTLLRFVFFLVVALSISCSSDFTLCKSETNSKDMPG
jgi:hypothetical protein